MSNEAPVTLPPRACREAAARVARHSPTQAALDATWQTLRETPRVAATYAGHALDRHALVLDVEPGVVPDCPACRETCCHGPHLVSLRLADCARLLDAGLDASITRPGRGSREATYESHPDLRQVEQRDAFRRFPVLGQRESGACHFLDADGRCSIYAIRPLACRAFPYRLDDALDRIRMSSGCPTSRRGGSPEAVELLVQATVDLFNAKVRDLLLVEHGRDRLEALGLRRLLPPTFADVLRRGFGADNSGQRP